MDNDKSNNVALTNSAGHADLKTTLDWDKIKAIWHWEYRLHFLHCDLLEAVMLLRRSSICIKTLWEKLAVQHLLMNWRNDE